MKTKTGTRIPIESIILGTLAVAGVVALFAVAPGIAPALKMFGVGKRKAYPKSNVTNALSRLQRKGLIEFRLRNGRKYIGLTEKGKQRLGHYARGNAIPQVPKKWDKKWRIVTFDIPEYARKTRDQVRRELSRAGFMRLQDSVWIFPYDCEEYVALLKADKRIGRGLLYVVADRVEYDTPLKKLFNLP